MKIIDDLGKIEVDVKYGILVFLLSLMALVSAFSAFFSITRKSVGEAQFKDVSGSLFIVVAQVIFNEVVIQVYGFRHKARLGVSAGDDAIYFVDCAVFLWRS